MMNEITLKSLNKLKESGEKITCLTAYDASFAKLINQAMVEIILVGDSLGTVIQGHDSTVPVSIADIIYHTKAVAKVSDYSLIIADMPFLSYATVAESIKTARAILQTSGAHLVKLEGRQTDVIRTLSDNGVAVCGHLGLLPQSINQVGAYQIAGTNPDDAEQLLKNAKAIEQSGAKLLVLECVPANLAKQITESLSIPTIGIGAGVDCDGQVLVLYDLLGISANRPPKFSKNYLADNGNIPSAIKAFFDEVKAEQFPTEQQSF